MPAKAGIQYCVTLELNISGAEYWIIRWSLSSGSPEGETRWRMMTANYAGRSPTSPAASDVGKRVALIIAVLLWPCGWTHQSQLSG